jgi:hypothetical protein
MMLTMTSCAELFNLDDSKQEVASLTVSEKHIDLMVGDQYVVPATLKPDTLVNKALYWESLNSSIVSVSENVLTAVAPGETKVVVTSMSGQLRDTCAVTVHPVWRVAATDYLYDMVVFANATVDGRDMDDSIVVGVFDDSGKLRGVGSLQESHGISYMLLRIYSENDESEQLTLRCYDRKRARITTATSSITFNGSTLGTLSKLYPIDF